MNTTRRRLAAAGLAVALTATLTGCWTDADKANKNLSTKAEHFEIQREIIGINTRSGEPLFQYIGRCSLESGSGESAMPGYLQISCKHGPNDYRTHFEKESPETAISSHQLGPIDVSVYHTDIRVKPEQLIPEISVETGTQ